MLFFKLQATGNLQFTNLRRGEMFFASPTELNDANECQPRLVFNGGAEHWQRLAEYVLFQGCMDPWFRVRGSRDDYLKICATADTLGSRIKQVVRNKDVGLEELPAIFVQALRESVNGDEFSFELDSFVDIVRNIILHVIPKKTRETRYIESFSTGVTNPTLWGHYAAADRGYAVVYQSDTGCLNVKSTIRNLHGFRKKEEGQITEIGLYDEEALELLPVLYRKTPAKLNALREMVPYFHFSEEEHHYDAPEWLMGLAAEKEESKVGLIKYSDWRYEQEIRAFLPVYNELVPDLRALKVDARQIRGLIFGSKMSNEDRSRAIVCCYLMREASLHAHEELPDFFFFEATPSVKRFGLQIVPFGSLSNRFDGEFSPVTPTGELDQDTQESIETVAKEITNSDKNSKMKSVGGS